MVVSHAVRVAGGVSAMLLKYCAKNWPVGQPPPGGLIVNVSLFETAPSGLRTVTGAEPAVAMSAAAMAAVTRVTLTNVVVRATPFQKSVAPETKLLPSAVRVKAGSPAVALLGVSVVRTGSTGPPLQLTWATAAPACS